ncbi:hypothetical protein EJB05_17074, partial [Eragrostis curvula]
MMKDSKTTFRLTRWRVETKVRLVMKSEEGMKLRERMATMKKMAADAVKENGSSDIAFREFFRIWQFDEDHQRRK